MGGDESDGGPSPSLAAFAAALRRLRDDAGSPSYRTLAARAHYSHTALAAAANGRVLPTLPVTLAFVAACGADVEAWRARWEAVRDAETPAFEPVDVAPPWPVQPVEDGADPEQACCTADAVTVHARKVARHGRRNIVGQVELRWSRRRHAAWGRFLGFPSLDHLAREHFVEVVVGVVREPDTRFTFRIEYAYDWHYGDLVVTGRGPVHAFVVVLLDGAEVAAGQTDRVALP